MWEDWKYGFYDNISGTEKGVMINKVIEMFSSEILTREYMKRVINEWGYSCEHNLTNEALNKIAYIGQAACCIYYKIPNSITMEAWNLLPPEVQERSDKIALEMINEWEYKNKFVQLCLNLN